MKARKVHDKHAKTRNSVKESKNNFRNYSYSNNSILFRQPKLICKMFTSPPVVSNTGYNV